ncbi:MAG: spore coat U domain-containing protein [Alphaproteobacteria bacterium]|nr:spore coat U domain-containing protein [Alphaproteobacteria bacterium]MBU1517161.1 spore coat U domain-containing protein [Alphaproteobacteria bacterium]MBU2096506.1 spore coat U domain-containing protein [Alphaproteobacteria bacterium]MBU2151658.1 spore coat U domain-containing protein [Alphaproteobacteria bacterium]MBU2305464.1 spore coat U domain-containing protein [Alphaproteobacteria bacterium]
MTRQGGTETLNYQLYVDALYLSPWTSSQTQLYLLTQMGVGQTVYVYGRIPAGQGVRVGDYTDAPGILITY